MKKYVILLWRCLQCIMEFEQKNKNIIYQSGYTFNTAEDNNLSTFRALSLTRKSVSRLQRPRLWRERLLLPLSKMMSGSLIQIPPCRLAPRLRRGRSSLNLPTGQIFNARPGSGFLVSYSRFALLKYIVKSKTFQT